MPTLKQLEANRRNALKSTGPRTPGGKAASSTNALKTGIYAKSLIIPGEDVAELETLIADFYEIHQPAAADERSLVDTLIVNEWTLRRLRKAECQIWDTSIQSGLQKTGAPPPTGSRTPSPAATSASPCYAAKSHRASAALTTPSAIWSSSRSSAAPNRPRNPLNPNPKPRNWLRSIKKHHPPPTRPPPPLRPSRPIPNSSPDGRAPAPRAPGLNFSRGIYDRLDGQPFNFWKSAFEIT
jgi:hypothetical protein